MKKLYTLWLCFALCQLFPILLKADTLEIAGADIRYFWKNDSICTVQLNVYTLCNGTSLNDVRIKISSPQNGFTSYSKQATLTGGDIMDLWCDTGHQHLNSCTNSASTSPGFRKYTALAEFNLKNSAVCEYYFSWDTCCRTKIITTGAALNHFYIDAYMRNCTVKKMATLPYDLEPFFYAKTDYCNKKRNMPVDYNSYTYELTTPRQFKNTEVIYKSSYSIKNPFVFSTNSTCKGIEIDDHGSMTFNPSQPDVSPVAFKMARNNDTLNGYSSRDVIYMSMVMQENAKPIISGINGTNQFVKEFMPGSSQCFTIHSFDVDDMDSVTLIGTQKPGSATFNVETGKRFPKGTFCWTPDASYISNKPYELRIVAEDNVKDCKDLKLKGKTEKSIFLYVCEHNNQHSCNVGINELALNKLLLFPQPSQSAVYVKLNESKITDLQITDMAGRIFSPNYIWEGNNLKIDLEKFKSGSYILKIQTPGNIYNSKLIIRK